MENLKAEGFGLFDCTFGKTGDIMEDALKLYENTSQSQSSVLKTLGIPPGKYVLCTSHRPENTDYPQNLNQILQAWLKVAEETDVIVLLHPRTRKQIHILPEHRNLHFIEPVGYLENLRLIAQCAMVMTDSGGMQKEAYWNKKFCITLRDETEWTELTDLSCNFLTGADFDRIIEKYNATKQLTWQVPGDVYGGGNSRKKIFEMIIRDATGRGII
jgi:UDP-GlcNAc3NAcA epimerase